MKFTLSSLRAGNLLATLALSLLLTLAAKALASSHLPAWDFTVPADTQGWQPAHDLSAIAATTNGIEAAITGGDPYFIGPARDFPEGQPLYLRLRIQSAQAGVCQVFYFQTAPAEANSVRFTMPAGKWVEGRVAVPALGKGFRMRIDPPGIAGKVEVQALRFEARGTLPDFDFSTLPDATEWIADHDISKLEPSLEGVNVSLSGGDPYLHGPSRNYPANTLLWLNMRLKSDQSGSCQVFYFQDGATEANSVHFNVPGGEWTEARVPVPALGANYRLRIDPPGSGGSCLLGRLWFQDRILLPQPVWPKPAIPEIGPNAFTVASGDLKLLQNSTALGGFELQVDGEKMAAGHTQPLIGYLDGKQMRWLALTNGPSNPLRIDQLSNGIVVSGLYADAQGGTWNVRQTFQTGASNEIRVASSVSVNQARNVAYLPMFTLLPGLGSFGTNKNQGLFCGLEYLENEPSSSEADVIGMASRRQVPDSLKITMPLMSIQAGDRYVGLIWEPAPQFSALFDSPDRVFQSGGHVMGILFPGSNGSNREEGNLLPYDSQLLAADEPLVLTASLIGGRGQSVVPAVRQYIALKGVPAVPDPHYDARDFARLEAHGWLDSQIRGTNLFRHAAWAGFGFQQSADAAVWMSWLSGLVDDSDLASRLEQTANLAIASIPPQSYNAYQIGHVRSPAPALVLGAVSENAEQSRLQGFSRLQQFKSPGTVVYSPGQTDYGKTHWTNEANGLTASILAPMLQDAAFSGNKTLIQEALKHLRALKKFESSVPRGAQTWEVPLHTPDILASAYLLRAYTLGYELSGDPYFLEQARYWAWTGVPFVYLTPPTDKPVGIYGTIAVLGATGWVAPVWMGLPVQWCGLVYSEALFRFAKYDPDGPWRQIAEGITAAGEQFTWPLSDRDRQGLLPDLYVLRAQLSDGPAINPGTALASSAFYYGRPSYDFKSFLRHGLMAHAPGAIENAEERADGIVFQVRGWSAKPSYVLVNGVWKQPRVKIDGNPVSLASPHRYDATNGRLILQVTGSPVIEIIYPAIGALKIQRESNPTRWSLHWPAEASRYVLEESSRLPDPWMLSALPVQTVADGFIASGATTNERGFFRLRLVP
jgi:hypothetical protein